MTTQTDPSTRTSGAGGDGSRERAPQAGRPWAIVAGREVVVRLTNRAFLVSTLITLVFIVGIGAFSAWQSGRTSTATVAVTSQDAGRLVSTAAATARAADSSTEIEATTVPSEAAARSALTAGDADAWLHQGSNGSWVLTSTDTPGGSVQTALADAVRSEALSANAAAAGTSVEAIERGTVLATERLDGAEDNTGAIRLATLAFALLFFMAAMLFGQQIAASVVEEKQSRLVEIIATAIPLRELLAGKVLGNSLLALGQVILYGAVGLVAVSFTDLSGLLPGLSAAVVWFVVFFAVGFFALACLFAVAGALASRTEDLQSTTSPMTMVLMLVYVIGFTVTGTALKIASFVPIMSVVAMPGRILSGEAAWWEPVVALLLMLAFAAVTVVVGERIYRRSLMQTRGKMSWREGLKASDA
ncbi:ABC transporter permease [Terracoccus luteus]|uniref:ABC-2 type transport system permease protein n=1 Tax=Terracoccus luteus TaxID=53356 RepID=A0A839PY93_9MICO|nr:ABC transporter permease [Terracoccus luteus]MBB2988103.1 ABC-2 type transport system permease protein [Terracoccus luteus]MCP2173754.1 ABC-2 type transport system permease protein [Terracoccus luteus]